MTTQWFKKKKKCLIISYRKYNLSCNYYALVLWPKGLAVLVYCRYLSTGQQTKGIFSFIF